MKEGKKELPVFSSYSAGANRTKLKVFAEGKRGAFPLYAKRGKVGKHEGGNHLFVFVNEVCPAEEAEVAVILKTGYSFSKAEGSEPIVWGTSDAACESGVLMVVPFGFEYVVWAYKNRGPKKYFRVTREGVVDITDEVAIKTQQPI